MVDARVASVTVAAGDYYFNSVPFKISDGVGTSIVFDVGFLSFPFPFDTTPLERASLRPPPSPLQ